MSACRSTVWFLVETRNDHILRDTPPGELSAGPAARWWLPRNGLGYSAVVVIINNTSPACPPSDPENSGESQNDQQVELIRWQSDMLGRIYHREYPRWNVPRI